MDYIRSQFGRPRGLFGILAGLLMARLNRERNAWTVELLDVQPADHVLEVGFGPGLAIEQVAELAVDGFVAGIDHSETMVRQAGKRNATAISDGRVELRRSSASSLPYADAVFDKVYAVNSMWPEAIDSLREMHRVLKTGGLVAIALQPKWAKTEAEVREVGREMADQLAHLGFGEIRQTFKILKPVTAVCVRGIK